MAKWIIGIIVVLLVAGAVWYSGVLGNMHPAVTTTQTATTTPDTTATQPQPENGMAATNDASDAALTQDTAAVDAQMQGLTTDNSNVDSSLSDKQVTQSY